MNVQKDAVLPHDLNLKLNYSTLRHVTRIHIHVHTLDVHLKPHAHTHTQTSFFDV